MKETRHVFRALAGAIVPTGIHLEFPVVSMGLKFRGKTVLAPLCGTLGKIVHLERHSLFFPQESFRWTADCGHAVYLANLLAALIVVAIAVAISRSERVLFDLVNIFVENNVVRLVLLTGMGFLSS